LGCSQFNGDCKWHLDFSERQKLFVLLTIDLFAWFDDQIKIYSSYIWKYNFWANS